MSATAPTVYFIDDSATMREVIKIAFRRENINVVACHDATTALVEIEKNRQDIVISDVIMPDKDGYEVCQHIKGNPELAKIPVLLMSGVVNRAVAEKAFAVKADELLRKPFQPQDLITRVRHLLKPNGGTPAHAAPANAAMALSSIFSAATPVAPKPVAAAQAPRPAAAAATNGHAVPTPAAPAPVAPAPVAVAPAVAQAAPVVPPVIAAQPARVAHSNHDAAKLKIEVLRLEGLVKKLQSELLAEREYSKALEAHIKTLQEADE